MINNIILYLTTGFQFINTSTDPARVISLSCKVNYQTTNQDNQSHYRKGKSIYCPLRIAIHKWRFWAYYWIALCYEYQSWYDKCKSYNEKYFN